MKGLNFSMKEALHINEIKISVIIPIYNTEKYIEKCLDSVVNQTIKDIEVICINDGSTDNSLDILNRYAQKIKEIKLITNQENLGVSAARNSGLKIAKGAYISFIDSDDYIDLDYLEKLYNTIIKNNCDIAASSIIRKKNSEKYRVHYEKEEIFETLEDKIRICSIPKCCYVWNKLYKKELIKDNLFREGVYFEDVLWLPEVLKQSKKLVTVTDINYYYRVNPNSIVKMPSDKKQKDSYNSKKYIIQFFNENNLKLSKKEKTITKQTKYLFNIPILKVKEVDNIEAFLLIGSIPVSKKVLNNDIFLVFNTGCFGDVLLCNSLCQNIKKEISDSKVIFITDKKFKDAAKYQKDVDKVIVYDKRGIHKGFWGMLKFAKEFPYKKPKCSFITYKNERNYIISKLIGSKNTIMANTSKKKKGGGGTQVHHKNLLQNYLGAACEDLPIKFEIDNNFPNALQNNDINGKKYIVLCAVSRKNVSKDMPINTCITLVKELNKLNEKVVFTGIGENNLEYANQIKQAGCQFINLTNKTDIPDLARVVKNSKCLISVDTGTMHLGYALGVKTICMFFEEGTKNIWAPDEKLYPNVKVLQSPSLDEIIKEVGINV